MNNSELNSIQARIGYNFVDPKFLIAAFTHSSYVNEHEATGNERIEFLGDCVLNFLVGEYLFGLDRSASEGKLSSRRAALVSRAPLSRIVDKLGLIEYLRVGAGVDKRNFSDKARSDVLEALIGAVYLDGGIEACRTLLDNIFYPFVEPERDYKSALQERAVSLGLTVSYNTATAKNGGFTATASVGGQKFDGKGGTKRLAQANAAKLALESLSAVTR